MSTHSEWYRQQAFEMYESYKKLRRELSVLEDDQTKTKIVTEWIEAYIPECDIINLRLR